MKFLKKNLLRFLILTPFAALAVYELVSVYGVVDGILYFIASVVAAILIAKGIELICD